MEHRSSAADLHKGLACKGETLAASVDLHTSLVDLRKGIAGIQAQVQDQREDLPAYQTGSGPCKEIENAVDERGDEEA